MNATLQLILTYSILALVSVYVIYKLINMLWPSKKETIGCGSGCSCDSVKLKKDLSELRQNRIAN